MAKTKTSRARRRAHATSKRRAAVSAPRNRADSEKAVAKALPGWRVVSREELRQERKMRPPRAQPDAVAPPIADIKAKRGMAIARVDLAQPSADSADAPRQTDV